MRNQNAYPLMLLGIVLFCAGCSDDEGPVRVDPVVYSGITKTDATGAILEEDPDDWKDTSFLRATPAFPNPASGGTTIKFILPDAADVSVTIHTPTKTIRNLASGQRPMGTSTLFWDDKDDAGDAVAAGIYRVTITATTANNDEYSTYGDVQVEALNPAP